jgi:predicted N-formylglutamate amidohydrolase
MRAPPLVAEAFEQVSGEAEARLVITCEHASQRLPAPWRWPEADHRLLGTHWTYDLGAEELARELADAARAPAVLARFSRLLVDANRPEDDPTLCLPEAEGQPVELNRSVSEQDLQQRIETCWRPYHAAIDSTVADCRAEIVFAVHTFTPWYRGTPRQVDIGVLFDQEQELGERLARGLAEHTAARVELNEPYSGQQGFIYSAERHARAHDRKPLEIEVRQDLAVQPEFRARVVRALVEMLG